MLGVYLHVPFCEKKCNYCAFSSFVTANEEKERYIESLIDEINSFHKKYSDKKYKEIDTIYFGGGTPSVLSTSQFARIVDAIYKNFDVKNAEFTVEVNPNSIDEEKLRVYKQKGVNRISIGVQSLNNEDLSFIGRLHDKNMAISSIKMAKKYFKNISCDLIIGLPYQNEENFNAQIQTLIDCGVTHISSYMLQVEPNTPLEKMVKENRGVILDEDDTIKIYDSAVKFLALKNFKQYEVSNFALEGYESKHNFKYWSGEEYVGFGLSSHSLLNDCRIANASKFEDYYKRQNIFKETLGKKEKIEEHIMLGLRCCLGISKSYLKNLGYNIEDNEYVKDFKKREVLLEEEDKIFLNSKFYGVNNFIIASLLP